MSHECKLAELPVEVFCSVVPARTPRVKLHTRKADGHNAIHIKLYNNKPRGGELYRAVGANGAGKLLWELIDSV